MQKIAKSSRWFLASIALLCLLAVACGGGGEKAAPSGDSKPAPAAPPKPSAEPTPASSAPLGSSAVEGMATYEGKVPKLRPVAMNADPDCASKHSGPVASRALVLGEGQTLANVFVQVKNPPEGNHAAPTEPAVIDQVGCLYEPYVMGVVAGQTLLFKNSDGILHNVHGLPKENREFNIGMPATVTESETTLSRPEPVFPVKCDVHPWMKSYVAVLSHPYFATTDETGAFRIEGLPAGTYEVEAWHEKLGVTTASITVGDGETGTAAFTFQAPG